VCGVDNEASVTEDAAVIGVFDSGVGGLSVLRALRQQMPDQAFVYVADQAHVPYGSRPMEEVRAFSEEITRFLIAQGAALVVVACNTASAAALRPLRIAFPETAFVGMEPAVKPAAKQTRSGVVGVLATPATFQGELYASVVERFAQGVRVLQDTCPGLVNEIEAGRVQGAETRRILEKALHPMLTRGLDTVVLGCTHYPFVIPLIKEIVGPAVRVIDPAPAVARQTGRLLAERGLADGERRQPDRFWTTGEVGAFAEQIKVLLGDSTSQVGHAELNE
jgi:glutamate racemase